MTVFRLMKSGKLPFIKVSRRFTRIREKDLEVFLDKHTYGKGKT
ncbi:helix-turn-helix domain-containing protein [Chloroflexota bacterium]